MASNLGSTIEMAPPDTFADPISVIVTNAETLERQTFLTSRSILADYSSYYRSAFTDPNNDHYVPPTASSIHLSGSPQAFLLLLTIYHKQTNTLNSALAPLPESILPEVFHGLAQLVHRKFNRKFKSLSRVVKPWIDAIQADNTYAKANPTALDAKKRDHRMLFVYWIFGAEEPFRRETRFWMKRMYKEMTASARGDTYRSGYRCHMRDEGVLGREGIGEATGGEDVVRPFEDLPEWVGNNMWDARTEILTRLLGLIRNIYNALHTSLDLKATHTPSGQLTYQHTLVCGHESILCDYTHFGLLSSLLMRMGLYPNDYMPTEFGLSLQLNKFSLIGLREVIRSQPRLEQRYGHVDFDVLGRLERELTVEGWYGLKLDGERARVPVGILRTAVGVHLEAEGFRRPEGLDWGD